ncbi:MAG: ABC transporter ATP-binding protein [Armatimonadota bacterium]|nr:ABC transporter ATP-binding protein [Armatimonadota bacterium]
MSSRGLVRARRVWKRFRTDRQRRLLRDQVGSLVARLRGEHAGGWRWALRDVSLEVAPGEAVGIVGVNGSGKSTFLKILSRVTYPYAGEVELIGRVAGLIEIRAGIHPDLTGRENVYLYGSLLGLSRAEVAARFDDIVAFAELGDAIDRQTKYFSSGMQMRLAFSVAASLEPDILLVDEVLAVGDAAFQQKCFDRMQTLLGRGVTLVFVSHDLASVEALCTRGLWLQEGCVESEGPVREVLGAYRSHIEGLAEASRSVGDLVRLAQSRIAGAAGMSIRTQHPLEVSVVLESDAARTVRVCFGLSEGPATPVVVLQRELSIAHGATRVACRIERLPFPRGRYYLWATVVDADRHELLAWQPVTHFDVAGPDLDRPPRGIVRLAPVHVEATWQHDAV